jgi:hypothetical protein
MTLSISDGQSREKRGGGARWIWRSNGGSYADCSHNMKEMEKQTVKVAKLKGLAENVFCLS